MEPPNGVLAAYDEGVALDEFERDDAQRALARQLDDVNRRLFDAHQSLGWFARITGRRPQSPRGLYIYGGVGRGKTMLMDLFCESPGPVSKKRAHFHEFMSDVHDRIAAARAHTPGDPIPKVATDIAASAPVLCFDELHVTDIADAMILGRLFHGLFDAGVTVVATSNVPPADLYRDGLNRPLFEPFIALIERHMDIVELESRKDFRLDKLAGEKLYFTPANQLAESALDSHWRKLTGGHAGKPMQLDVKGREVLVPMASMGVSRFSFDDLCAKPLGAADYLAIAHAFHTVLIDRIPVLSRERRNEARRLITLIDAFYDNRVGLIVSADAEPNDLYPAGDGAFLFERTASRLMEMRSEAYLTSRAETRDGRARTSDTAPHQAEPDPVIES